MTSMRHATVYQKLLLFVALRMGSPDDATGAAFTISAPADRLLVGSSSTPVSSVTKANFSGSSDTEAHNKTQSDTGEEAAASERETDRQRERDRGGGGGGGGGLQYFGWYSLTATPDMKANAGRFNHAFELDDPASILLARSLGATVLVNVVAPHYS